MYQKAKELVVDIFHLWSKYFSNRQVEPIFKQLIRSAGSREITPDKAQIDKQTQLNLEITKMLSSSIKTLGSTL